MDISLGDNSIHVLGADILALILDELFCEISPADFYSLALVHSSFYEGIKRFRGRSQTFHFGRIPGPKITRLTRRHIQDLLESPRETSIVSNIRQIIITSDHESEDDEIWIVPCLGNLKVYGKWAELLNLIAAIPRLHTLLFKAFEPMPSFLVHQLERHHPTARLEIQNWTRHADGAGHTDPCEIALSKSVNLRSIHAELWASEARLDLRLAALKRITTFAPNLVEVRIRGEQDSPGYHFRPGRLWNPPSEDELRDKELTFMPESWSKNSIKSIEVSGKSYLVALNDFVDFSLVENLHIDQRQSDSQYAGGASLLDFISFKSLRHLTIVFSEIFAPIADLENFRRMASFILQCRPLESLEILESTGKNIDCQSIIRHHGPTLRRLALFETTNSRLVGGDAVSVSALESIREFCSNLENIGLNTLFSGEFESIDTTALSILAQIAPLRILRFKCGFPFETNRGYDSFENSTESYGFKFRAANGNWILKLWFFIQARRDEYGFRPIKEIHLMYPEHIRTSLGPRHFTLDIVRASERDDRPDEIRVDGNIPGSEKPTRRILKMAANTSDG
ncbi:hypothetical protein IFR05_006650 [Cadophora sp. M221]|nr:hypothetical protein IFR05_006650 [Cadophora sp. M221]